MGGYHIYYWFNNEDIYVSDDIDEVIQDTDNYPLSLNEKQYFDRHGYGLADRTFREGLFRLSPCSSLIIDENGLRTKNNWPLGEVEREPNIKLYKESVCQAIDNSLRQLYDTKKKIILCFSGGKDSLYIAKRMKKLGLKFDIVYWKINNGSQKIAEQGARLLDMELVVMDISECNKKEMKKVAENKMFFDHHYSLIHFAGCKEIAKRYGRDVILVNGQNSDSILTYGPSETKRTSYWKRYLLYGNNYFRKWIYKTIIELGFHRRFVLPNTMEEKNLAFLDNFKYCLILDKRFSEDYRDYLKNCLNRICQEIKFSSQNNLWMYLKVFTHIYGSDCQVVVNSAKYFGLDLLLPFSSEALIRAALTYKDDLVEMKCPKYALNN